jgi:hypothetical protein
MTAYLHLFSTANALTAWTVLYLIFLRPAFAADPRRLVMLLIAPHLFRYLGLVAFYPELFPVGRLGFQPDYLAQVAIGDTVAGLLGLLALLALALRWRGAFALVVLFSAVGLLDFANAGLSMALELSADPAALGPLGWVLMTLYLPMLTVSHLAILGLLPALRRALRGAPVRAASAFTA